MMIRQTKCGWLAACFLLVANAAALKEQVAFNDNNILVVDLRDSTPVRSDAPTVLAVQVCAGFMNRDESVAGAAYTIWDDVDLDWLVEIEDLPDPTFISAQDFVQHCIELVVQGRYIHYNYTSQQEILPNLMTLSSALDAVPLIKNEDTDLWKQDATMVFDAEQEFAGFSPYEATSYMFEHHAHQTTAMAKLNPGYEYTSKSTLHPPLVGFPHLQSADFLVKERLFTFFMPGGCIPLTKDHRLMEHMVQKNHPNTSQWSQPIIVYGYEDNTLGSPLGDPFEAETNCVKEHNMGQISTHFVPNLSFWARKAAITEPMIQNPSPSVYYDQTKTYISLVIGDGDSFNKIRGRNLGWVRQRVAYCKNTTMGDRNCFPLSWTMNQHAARVTPDPLRWYYDQAKATGQDFFLLPPSGHLYAYPSLMNDEDQQSFVAKTEEGAKLLNTSGTVDWEYSLTWKKAIHNYFPKLASNNIIQGVFAVNVPFVIPVFAFGSHEYYKLIDRFMVLFRPREWRGASGHTDIPFGKKSVLTEKDMAAEINNHPPGTVTYIYITSDGGIGLDNLYKMVNYLEDHVEVVNHEVVTQMALQRSASLGDQEDVVGGEETKDVLEAAAGVNHLDMGKQTEDPADVMVVDLRGAVNSDSPTLLSIQACIGLFNRNETIAGAAYGVWEQMDLHWLQEVESIDKPQFIQVHDFLAKCLTTVAKGYIHFNYDTQQVTVPNLVTLAAVLDAIPLIPTDKTASLINQTKAKMLFDAEKEFDGFSAYDATKYMFEHHAHETITMSKSDPGYDYSKSILDPPLTGHPTLYLADYIVKERLFNFFLLEGCISLTREHSLMETMTQHDNPNTSQWPQPIAVFGYDDVTLGAPGDPFEAETLCVNGHNMGQVATDFASDMSFFSRKGPISEPLQQNPSPKETYDDSTTYVAFVIGDGDNVGMMKGRNYPWVQQRLAYCADPSKANNCFPISWTVSPHLLHIAPGILRWYYEQGKATGQDFFLLPPSGYLYAYPSLMQDDDQASFVRKTEEVARLLNSSGTVDWEFELTWKGAINSFFPKYANKNVIKGVFAVNVPFNLRVWAFGRHEYYKLIHKKGGGRVSAEDGGDAVVLFRPREWRGTTGKSDIPFGKQNNLKPKDMAAEISGYPKGTVCYIYLTSDGGVNLDSLYDMVPYLEDHVKVVNHEIATDMALQRSCKLTKETVSEGQHNNLRHDLNQEDRSDKETTD